MTAAFPRAFKAPPTAPSRTASAARQESEALRGREIANPRVNALREEILEELKPDTVAAGVRERGHGRLVHLRVHLAVHAAEEQGDALKQRAKAALRGRERLDGGLIESVTRKFFQFFDKGSDRRRRAAGASRLHG